MSDTRSDIERDGEVVSRVLDGNKDAFSDIVYRYQDPLRAVLSFHCPNENLVEECLQEAFVHAYGNLAGFDRTRPFFPWLKTLAMNVLRSEFRRTSRERRKAEEYFMRLQVSGMEEDDGYVAEQWNEALHHCLEKIPESQAALVRSKYEKGVSVAALAERAATTVGALKLRLLRLREALRKCITNRVQSQEPAEEMI